MLAGDREEAAAEILHERVDRDLLRLREVVRVRLVEHDEPITIQLGRARGGVGDAAGVDLELGVVEDGRQGRSHVGLVEEEHARPRKHADHRAVRVVHRDHVASGAGLDLQRVRAFFLGERDVDAGPRLAGRDVDRRPRHLLAVDPCDELHSCGSRRIHDHAELQPLAGSHEPRRIDARHGDEIDWRLVAERQNIDADAGLSRRVDRSDHVVCGVASVGREQDAADPVSREERHRGVDVSREVNLVGRRRRVVDLLELHFRSRRAELGEMVVEVRAFGVGDAGGAIDERRERELVGRPSDANVRGREHDQRDDERAQDEEHRAPPTRQDELALDGCQQQHGNEQEPEERVRDTDRDVHVSLPRCRSTHSTPSRKRRPAAMRRISDGSRPTVSALANGAGAGIDVATSAPLIAIARSPT